MGRWLRGQRVQQLHLVGFTTELDGLILSARRGSKSGAYLVALDDRFLALIREAVRLQTGVDLAEEERTDVSGRRPSRVSHVDSALSPREIQARLRAGRSIADVAREAGVDEQWVWRFASPVLAEQAQVVARARMSPCRAPRKGESAEPLDASVVWNLAERGLRPTADELAKGWSAYHVRDALWVVCLRYASRSREQVAQWEYDAGERTVVALNRLGSELGYVDPARRRRRPTTIQAIAAEEVGPLLTPPRPTPSVPEPPVPRPDLPVLAARLAPPAKPAAKKPAAKKPAAKKPAAKKPAAKKPAAKKPAARKQAGRSSAAVAKKPTPQKSVAKAAVATKVIARPPPAEAPAERAARRRRPRRRRPRRRRLVVP